MALEATIYDAEGIASNHGASIVNASILQIRMMHFY